MMARDTLLFNVPRLTWPLKFLRARDGGSKDPQPPANPAPPPPVESPEKESVTPIKLDQAQETDPTRSLRAKVSRILKDLALDVPGVDLPEVVGGKNKPKDSPPPSPKDSDRGPHV